MKDKLLKGKILKDDKLSNSENSFSIKEILLRMSETNKTSNNIIIKTYMSADKLYYVVQYYMLL